MVPFPEKMAGN